MKKIIALWFVIGAAYIVLEGVWRGGWVHIAMLPIGGLCGVTVGAINQLPRFKNTRIILQSLIGTTLVLLVEFVAGCALNLWLGLDIWDYSARPGNVLGQICVQYAALWLALMPLCIWLDDTLRWRLFGEGEKYPLWRAYLNFITLR